MVYSLKFQFFVTGNDNAFKEYKERKKEKERQWGKERESEEEEMRGDVGCRFNATLVLSQPTENSRHVVKKE